MFNKGKPYVPPPTRAMGSAHPHDDLHNIDDELELIHESHEDEVISASATSYSHAAEERAMGGAGALDTATAESDPSSEQAASTANTQAAPQPLSGGFGTGSNSTGWGSGGDNHGNPPHRARGASSVLGNGMTFEGDISGVGQLVIEGTVKGDVRVSQVLINEQGSVEGTVHADVLDVHGRITGAIIAKQVQLHSTARVEGDITQEQLTIDRGAWFSGRSTQARRDSDATVDA